MRRAFMTAVAILLTFSASLAFAYKALFPVVIMLPIAAIIFVFGILQ